MKTEDIEKSIQQINETGVSTLIIGRPSETAKEGNIYKQGNNINMTLARIVGRERGQQKSLFDIDTYIPDAPQLEKLPKEAGKLLQKIELLFQANGYKPVTITNLDGLAKEIGTTSDRLKFYLIRLGGYIYPISYIKEEDGKKVRWVTFEQMITVEFGEKVEEGKTKDDYQDRRIGTKFASFIAGLPQEIIKISLNIKFVKDIVNTKSGQGAGFAYVTEDGYDLELSDMGYKIMKLTTAFTPRNGIGFTKLAEKLGYKGKDIRDRGKPRIKEELAKGFEELKSVGHLVSWTYTEEKELYKWEMSTKFVKRLGKKGGTVSRTEK